MPGIARRDPDLCKFCGICRNNVTCPAGEALSENCIGCGACVLACPGGAIKIVGDRAGRKEISISIDGKSFLVPERISLKNALRYAGIYFPEETEHCGVGGCWRCAVLVDGSPKPSCITSVEEGMVIDTRPEMEPLRVVTGFGPHMVGGVGTPIGIRDYRSPVEVALFTHGCNMRCPQCQNHVMAFTGGMEMKPDEASVLLSNMRRIYRVQRMAFSGGECTLNRRWLIQSIKELKRLNPDEKARIHVDTNGSLLTEDYLDELVSAGMTDAGIDLKGMKLETFRRITGTRDSESAEYYLKNAWHAVEYLIENYPQVFVGIGIPYNQVLISREEILEIGGRIAGIDESVQVCVLDYRPAFRRFMEQPEIVEMKEIKEILDGVGLRNVIAQTSAGHIGPL
ncbi:Coenzyme PQQ synthesis protein E [uncultured archaeon]|nr:Coenzyme PQQ synthesis protein E [uncultured archaeon]